MMREVSQKNLISVGELKAGKIRPLADREQFKRKTPVGVHDSNQCFRHAMYYLSAFESVHARMAL